MKFGICDILKFCPKQSAFLVCLLSCMFCICSIRNAWLRCVSNVTVIDVRVQKINKLRYKFVCLSALYAGEYRTSKMTRHLFRERDCD